MLGIIGIQHLDKTREVADKPPLVMIKRHLDHMNNGFVIFSHSVLPCSRSATSLA